MALRALLLTSAVVLAGCGGPAAPGITHSDPRYGFTVSYPADWQRAHTAVSPTLTEPREILSISNALLPNPRPGNCDAFGGAARADLAADGVFLTILERGSDPGARWPDFPPRPAHFGPSSPDVAEEACGDRPGTVTYWRNFTDAGRHFHSLVIFGPSVSETARRRVWAALDSLRFDPEVTPDWRASG